MATDLTRATVEDQIRQLREVLGARNDSQLAAKLGLTRYAVSRWKERGIVPPEHLWIITAPKEQVIFCLRAAKQTLRRARNIAIASGLPVQHALNDLAEAIANMLGPEDGPDA